MEKEEKKIDDSKICNLENMWMCRTSVDTISAIVSHAVHTACALKGGCMVKWHE